MSTITITNNTKLPIHAATEWNHIVQEYKNNILPGTTIDLPAANLGWQDLMVVSGFEENKVSHDQDWSSALSFGIVIAGALGTIAGTALTVITWGGSTPVLVATATVTAAGIATTLADGAVMIADLVVHPATVPALWGADGYTIIVSGGEVSGTVDKASGKFTA